MWRSLNEVPEELFEKVEEYCCNDLDSTEAVFEDRAQDFAARQILAELSGLTVNDTTQKHTAKIIFGDDRNAKSSFVYTDLSKEFEGYEFVKGKSSYRGEDPSEGGYVYAEPGMYENVAVLDVASMHPTSLIQLNLFGKYTPNFQALLDARLAIKHEDYKTAGELLGGKLKPYLRDPEDAEALSYALKIVINIVYGLTSAKFENPFVDVRNKDNIVAKRGALFMIDLKNFCQEHGWQVVHIKTDSIKIPNATPQIIETIKLFGAKYGYTFEHEATYDKFCLVNDAVYIAHVGWAEKAKKIGT
jgi:DNA polymerase elongation subunit (family B)